MADIPIDVRALANWLSGRFSTDNPPTLAQLRQEQRWRFAGISEADQALAEGLAQRAARVKFALRASVEEQQIGDIVDFEASPEGRGFYRVRFRFKYLGESDEEARRASHYRTVYVPVRPGTTIGEAHEAAIRNIPHDTDPRLQYATIIDRFTEVDFRWFH